jgi:thiol-disulfide isomerase/thioredoxin
MAKRAIRVTLAVLIFVVLVAAGLATYYLVRVKPIIRAGKQQGIIASVPDRPAVGGFGFTLEGGAKKTLADLRGKVVVIDVWATWCGTCRYTMPDTIALRNKYPRESVEVIGLDVDDKGWDKVKPFLQQHPEINYTMAVSSPAPSFLLQSIVDLNPLGKVSALPTVFVIDREGRVAGKFIEAGHEAEIDNLVASLLKNGDGPR